MSRYSFTNSTNGRLVHYGLDLPTGGYFFSEFYTDKEMEEECYSDEISDSQESMTLTELLQSLEYKFYFGLDYSSKRKLLTDFTTDPEPTPLQFNINKMFGKDLMTMLIRVQKDVNNLVNKRIIL